MRLLLISLLFAASACFGQGLFYGGNTSSAPAAKYSRVSVASAELGAVNTNLISTASDPKNHVAGHMLVVLLTSFSGSIPNNTVAGITNTAGDTFAAAIGCYNTTGLTVTTIRYVLSTAGNAADVISIVWNNFANYMTIQVIEYAYTGTALFDACAIGSATATSVSSASFTAATSTNLNVAVATQQGSGTNNWSPGSGYTLVNNTGSAVNSESEDRNPAPSGSQTASIGFTPSSPMQISVVSFK